MMHAVDTSVEARLARVEQSLARTRVAAASLGAALAFIVVTGFTQLGTPISEEVRTRSLVVVDDKGVVRVKIGQDPINTQRRSRSAGITIHDSTGAERGGMSTFDDLSVVFAMDAPRGVGHPMRDRLGLRVDPNGSAHVMLLDNQTRAVAKLHSDGNGGGGVQVFKWDMDAKQVHVKTFTYDGERRQVNPFGQ
jgi:hypothetical protein